MTDTERLRQPAEEETWRHRPDTLMYITPDEPYNDTVIQFSVLREMGYPVELQPADPMGMSEVSLGDKIIQWEIACFPGWVTPVVHSKELDKYIESMDCPGDCFGFLEPEKRKMLEDHPVCLVSSIDYEPASWLASNVEAFRSEGVVKFMESSHNPSLVTEDLLERCFMASFNRFIEQLKSGRPAEDHNIPDDDSVKLYSELIQAGQTPITPEELAELIRDYYKLVEELVPEFKALKQVGQTHS